ncbi:hypothetical protein [Ideonella paludis]|uniref:Uncharacterized protein n=1 Tax=Ideonella paludis TaxID=1233411 RepID=A0ABS5DVB7_9BURK|nr:hypothetical protein [Ideonella paludis]MBQ0935095.1 hypothetical protein [Ideonella paludis]
MNKRILKNTLAAAGVALAYLPLAQAGWTQEVKVKSVVVVSSGGINVAVEPALSGCTSQSGYGARYASIYPSHPGLKAMHANLLLAMNSGTSVRLYLTDPQCTVGEMVLGEALW